MTDFDPYVSDPVERPLPPVAVGLRPLLIALILLILLGAAVGPLLRDRQVQDPSLEAPAEPAG